LALVAWAQEMLQGEVAQALHDELPEQSKGQNQHLQQDKLQDVADLVLLQGQVVVDFEAFAWPRHE